MDYKLFTVSFVTFIWSFIFDRDNRGPLVDLRERQGRRGPNSFIFMQFSAKTGQQTHFESCPPSGKSLDPPPSQERFPVGKGIVCLFPET